MEFENGWDKAQVLEGRPWVLEGNLFSVKDFNGVTPPAQMDFDKTTFWVRMFNLPLACMGEDIGFRLGSSAGEVEAMEIDEDGVSWGSTFE